MHQAASGPHYRHRPFHTFHCRLPRIQHSAGLTAGHRVKVDGMGTVRKSKWRSGSFPVGMITLLMVGAFGVGGAAALLWTKAEAPVPEGGFSCMTPRTIDGDTFDCAGTRVGLQGVHAPETEGHCRPGRRCAPGDPVASTDNLRRMMRWNKVICQQTDTDRYGRTVARCTADGVDLSCAQVKGDFAILRYAYINCQDSENVL